MPHPKNITSDEDEALILDSIDQFLERDVKPVAHDLEAADEYPGEIADKMAELGLYGATISPEYGGLGLSAGTYVKIVERMSAVWMSVTGLYNAHRIMAARAALSRDSNDRAGVAVAVDDRMPVFYAERLAGKPVACCPAVARTLRRPSRHGRMRPADLAFGGLGP